MKKSKLLKRISLGLACLLGISSLAMVGSNLFHSNQDRKLSEVQAADSSDVLTVANISDNLSYPYLYGNYYLKWFSGSVNKSDDSIDIWNGDSDYYSCDFEYRSPSKIKSINVYFSSAIDASTSANVNSKIKVELEGLSTTPAAKTGNNVTFSSINEKATVTIKITYTTLGAQAKLNGFKITVTREAVATASVTKGTGLKDAYVSDSSTATSGSASGGFGQGTTVYAFAKLSAGYKAQSGWTKVSGTADSENAIYRVASYTMGTSDYSFGTINAVAKTTTVSFDQNGGTGGQSSTVTASYGSAMPSLSASAPERTGYTFTGYYDNATSGTKYYNANLSSAKNWNKTNATITLYAHWNVKVSSLEFNQNGGEGGITDTSYSATYGSDMPTLSGSAPTKEYYEFLGYFDGTGDDAIKYYNADLTSARTWDKDTTDKTILYAKYEPLGTLVTLNQEGGTDGTELVVCPLDTAMPSATMPTRSGYTFNGYFTEQNGAGVQYYNADGSSAKNWDNDVSESILYASWTMKSEVAEAITKINNIENPVVLTDQCKTHIQEARTAYDLVDASDKAGVSNSDVLLAAETRIAELEQAKADAGSVETLISAIGEVHYFSSKTALENARAAYDALNADGKGFVGNYSVLTAAESEYGSQKTAAVNNAITVIDAIPSPAVYSEECLLALNAAKDAMDLVHDDDLALITNKDYYFARLDEYSGNRSSAVESVKNAINAIGAVSYPGSKASIENAESLYNALNESDKTISVITNKEVLDDARVEYDSQRATARENVISAINAIGAVSYPSSKAAIENAESLFNALDEADKNNTFITNIDVKDAARINFDNQRANAIANVIAAIEDIGDISYPGSKQKLEYAELLYSQLDTSDQNSTVITNKPVMDADRSEYNSQRTTAVNAVIDAIAGIQKPFDSVRKGEISNADQLYNALAESEKNSTWVTNLSKLEDAHAADAVADLFEALGNAQDIDTWREKVSDARDAYTALSSSQQGFISASLMSLLTDREDAIYVMDLINDIGDPHWTSASKTSIDAANDAYDDFVSAGKDPDLIANYQNLVDANTDFNNVQAFVDKVDTITSNPFEYSSACKELMDEARNYYQNTLDADQKGIAQTDASSYYNLLVNYENAFNAMHLIDQINDLENNSACKEKIEAAKAAIDALNTTTELPLVNEDLLKELNDKVAAWAVIEEINALYPMSYGKSCEDAINSARDSFDALTADQQGYVINLDMLVKAENDYAKVKEVVEKVNNLGDIRYDQNSQNKINEARNAYEALTSDQKAFYPSSSLQTIVDYETAYEALDKIYNIGEVSYDTDSEGKINDSRQFYNSLTEAQKRLIHASDLEVLTSSETAYGQLQKKANTLVIILLVVVSLTIVGGAIFLFLLIKKGKKDNETVKVASIGGLLPLILFTSHYVDPSYIILYVLSGIAVVLWLAILGLVVHKKCFKKEPLFVKKEAAPVVHEEACIAEPSEDEVEANAILESVKKSEEESKLVVDKKGNLFQIRFIKSFTAKLSQSSDSVKEKYNELKNYVLSYGGVTSRVSWYYDSINASKEQLLKFQIRGKTLCLYFSSKIENPGEAYKLEDAKGNRYEKVPYLFRIKSDKKFEQVKELIELLMKRVGLKKGKTLNDDYKIPFESTEVLLQKGLIKEHATHLEVKDSVKRELLKSVAVERVDELMSDDTAESLIEDDIVVHQKIGKREIINVDTLSTNFKDGDLVNLEALIEKKLVPSKTEYVKVLARGVLDKKLNVDLHDYSIQAVKMILLTGGTVKKIHE